MNKPILALDIDGVLNRLGQAGGETKDTWEDRTVEILRAEVPNSPFHRQQKEDIPDWPVVVNPQLHSSWLATVRDLGVEIVWATTWENQANKCFAPFYGLGEWPVACSTLITPPRFREETPNWKARCLQEYAGDRPLIWVDDMNWHYAALTLNSEKDNAEAWREHEDPSWAGLKPDDGPWGLETYWGLQFKHVAICVEPNVGLIEDTVETVNRLLEDWL